MLCYQNSNFYIIRYINADWSDDVDEQKFTSEYTLLLNEGAISWSNKKKSCVASSIMEAKFVVCIDAVQEAIWLRKFFQ